jgi:hypothetical protein
MSLNYYFSLLPHSHGENSGIEVLIVFNSEAGKCALHQSFGSAQ